jgi:predicted CXXCH cytochrome family protein
MKSIGCILLISVCILAPMQAIAEPVAHHGMKVDADSPADRCISCHDGSVAHIVSYCTVKCDFSTAHSLFKTYPPRNRTTEFAAVAAVTAKGIKLQNGQVTCVSCHNLRNPGENHLVVDGTKTDLCRICHIRK